MSKRMAALVFSLALMAGLVLAGPLFKNEEHPNPGTEAESEEPSPRHPMASSSEQFRAGLEPENFGKEKADEVRAKYDIDLSFPQKALEGDYEGVMVGPPAVDGYGEGFVVLYTNDVAITITHWSTARDARTYLGILTFDLPEQYDPYVRKTTVGSRPAYAVSRVNIPAEPSDQVDPETGLIKVKDGTGLRLSSRIAWAQGRYVICVSSEDHNPEELLVVAEELQLQPNKIEQDEAVGFWGKENE